MDNILVPPPSMVCVASNCVLVRMIDGDTFEAAGGPLGQLSRRIRLLCVDAPEVGHQFWGHARDHLLHYLAGVEFELWQLRTGRVNLDRYGRMVCVVQVGEWDVGFSLIADGLAVYQPQWGPLPSDEAYRAAEASARAARRGIWSLSS